jgi:nicotinamide-nucleotide amidase
MPIEIVAVGDELLAGRIPNTNGAAISKRCAELGIFTSRHTVLPDDPEEMKRELKSAMERSPCVIVTGGLGPTCDDHTRAVAADLCGTTLVFDDVVSENLMKRFGKHRPELRDQSTVLKGAMVMMNEVGTAPGFILEKGESCLILLPGVPYEMKAMLETHVVPYLQERFQSTRSQTETIYFCMMREMEIDPSLRTLQKEMPRLRIGIYPGHGTLTVTFSGEGAEIAKARLAKEFPKNMYSSPTGKIEEALHTLLIERKMTFAAAESCSGGRVAEKITALPGASDYFLGSIVAYSNSLKTDLLHVPREVIEQHGAVSKEVAEAMLQGLFKTTHADSGVAITGIAGPTGGTSEKPIGTLWIAFGKRNHPPRVEKFFFPLNRETIALVGATFALSLIWQHLNTK